MNIPQSIYNWYRNTIRNPKYRWWIILGTLAYLLLPFDISPDFLPIIGWIDDGILATLLVAELSQILLERLNSQKSPSESNPTQPSNSSDGSQPAGEKTVEVNSVSVE